MTGEDPKGSKAREVTQPQVGADDLRSQSLRDLRSDPDSFLKPREVPPNPGEKQGPVAVSHKDAYLFPRAVPPLPPKLDESHFSESSDDEGPSKSNPVGPAVRAMASWFPKRGRSDSATKAAVLNRPNTAKRGNTR
ncbi:hypothetical protein RKD37_002672 [Streptomyces ambofaciens]